MDLPALEELLTHLKSLPVAEKSETNIFSVGARGHYENPVSDLLAFFIDPDAPPWTEYTGYWGPSGIPASPC